jgi:hypothetical protein
MGFRSTTVPWQLPFNFELFQSLLPHSNTMGHIPRLFDLLRQTLKRGST